ncbi:MAG TPA: hypothetical protein VFD39_11110 [Trueperaceae bacterium]|nr:hypothetical protein [Trueperaceae bacterium]
MCVRSLPVLLLAALLLGGCSVEGPLAPPSSQTLTLTPDAVTVGPGLSVDLQAALEPSSSSTFVWRYEAGSLSADGASAIYVAPQELGTYVVTVSVAGKELAASATITVAETSLLTPSVTLSSVSGESVVATGMTLEIAAAVTVADAATLTWNATGGEIAGEGEHAVYTAPHDPGSYVVSASLPESVGVVGTFVVEVPGAILEPFTIAVIPDTQTMARAEAEAPGVYPPLIAGIGEWLVANVGDQNIEFVTQVGDVVWDAPDEAQWSAALAGLDLLDGVVPYSVSLGDHEYAVEEDKASSTAAFHGHFGPSRYAAYDWYGGSHVDGLSQYQIFEAGGRRFLHLSLEWEPLGPADNPSTPLAVSGAMFPSVSRNPSRALSGKCPSLSGSSQR